MFKKRHPIVTGMLALGLLLTACGGDDDGSDADTGDAAAPDEAGAADDGATDDGATDDGATDDGATDDGAADDGAADDGAVFELHGTDYAFPNAPDTLAVGTELRLVNQSDAEVHEAVVFRIPDDEDRPIATLLDLPEEETEFLEEGFKGVLIAMPEEEAFAPAGPVILDEPGRYAVICFLPIGHDPDELAAAMDDPDAEGPPDIDGGPPHFTAGMVAEIVVEG